MFVWLFHRISGLVLIVLIGWKIFTGFASAGTWPRLTGDADASAFWTAMHKLPVIDVLLLALFTYHSLYGLRTVLMDLGLRRRENLLFWLTTGLGAVLLVIMLVLIYGH